MNKADVQAEDGRVDPGKLLDTGFHLSRVGRHAEALAIYDRFLTLGIENVDAINNRGVALLELKRYRESIASFDSALKIQPEFHEAWCNRGVAYFGLAGFRDALESYDRALKINPAYAKALNNRGNVLARMTRYEEALASYEGAIALEADFLDALANRGAALANLGRFDEALESVDRVLRIKPDFVAAHVQGCMINLMTGNYGAGFRKYEWRWLDPAQQPPRRKFAQPLWIGQCSLQGKSILLHQEQGLGDIVQVVRYVPFLAARGAAVVLEVPRVLEPLMAGLAGAHRIIVSGDPLPLTDFHCPMLSLPLACDTRLETIPAATPYLSIDRGIASNWRARIGAGNEKLIGICWRGNPEYRKDHERSIPFADFAPLLTVPGVRFVSLQKELTEEEQRLALGQKIVHPGVDFRSTAEMIAGLDLVISVDTVWTHWAGAIGKPFWVLLPFTAHWVWLMDRKDSPWYPTARLFRQTKFGDWRGVIRDAMGELACLS